MLSTAAQQKIFARLLSNPSNARCADCNAKSPTWASIDFGVFVCLNCSGAHRALGPSVTRVRSTKLDTWQTEWIQLMELGNELCNNYWLANIGLSSKPNTNSPLDQIKRFVADKYLKRKFAKSNESDPVTNLKEFRAIKKQNDINRVDFKKLKDEDKFKTVSGGDLFFETFDFRKNSGSQQKTKKKQSFDIFNFDESPKKNIMTTTTATPSINLYEQLYEPQRKTHDHTHNHGHSLDFHTISHGHVSSNFNFHHQSNTNNNNPIPSYLPLHQSNNFQKSNNNQFQTQPNTNSFNFANVFNQPASLPSQTQFTTNSQSISNAFDIFGSSKPSSQPQQPVNMNINMYANNINFNFVAPTQHKTQQKKDPFRAIDEFNFF